MQEERHCTLQWHHVFLHHITHLGQYRKPFWKTMLSVTCKVIYSWLFHNTVSLRHATASRDWTSRKVTKRFLGGPKASLEACLKTNTKNLTLQLSCLHRWLCEHVRRSEDVMQLLKVPVRLLDSSSGWGGLASCLGGQLLPWGLASCWLASCLLCTSHDFFVGFGTLCGFLSVVVWCALKVVWCWIWSAEPNSGVINLIVPHMPDVRIGMSDDKRTSENARKLAVDAIRTRETDD